MRYGRWGGGCIYLSSRNRGYICLETCAKGVTRECLAWVGRAAQHGGPVMLTCNGSAGVALSAIPLFPYCPVEIGALT